MKDVEDVSLTMPRRANERILSSQKLGQEMRLGNQVNWRSGRA